MASSSPASKGARDPPTSDRTQPSPFSWHADDDPDASSYIPTRQLYGPGHPYWSKYPHLAPRNQKTYDLVYYRQVLVIKKECDEKGPFLLVSEMDGMGGLPVTGKGDDTEEEEMKLRGSLVNFEFCTTLYIRFSRAREWDVDFTIRVIDEEDLPQESFLGFPYYEVH